jgi:ABC-type nitrate/sulfonate/bicarbonate transport system ATPase subunit
MYEYEREETLLTVRDLCVTYDKPVLKGVSFRIDNITRPGLTQGQTVAVLGPSGIGKTQLFRCLSGLQKPTSGTVILSDPGADGSPRMYKVEAGQVGVVLQNYPLLQHRTVMGNLNLVAKTPQKREYAMKLLERMGLSDKRNRYPCELSGGQRQRVAIIQQLLCSSHFMLMDEPFSGLDPIAKAAMCKLINEITAMDEYTTTIIITHDLQSALITADTVLMLGRDREADGTPIPGARIMKTVDLIERGLTWRPDIESQPNYYPTLRELAEDFRKL